MKNIRAVSLSFRLKDHCPGCMLPLDGKKWFKTVSSPRMVDVREKNCLLVLILRDGFIFSPRKRVREILQSRYKQKRGVNVFVKLFYDPKNIIIKVFMRCDDLSAVWYLFEREISDGCFDMVDCSGCSWCDFLCWAFCFLINHPHRPGMRILSIESFMLTPLDFCVIFKNILFFIIPDVVLFLLWLCQQVN